MTHLREASSRQRPSLRSWPARGDTYLICCPRAPMRGLLSAPCYLPPPDRPEVSFSPNVRAWPQPPCASAGILFHLNENRILNPGFGGPERSPAAGSKRHFPGRSAGIPPLPKSLPTGCLQGMVEGSPPGLLAGVLKRIRRLRRLRLLPGGPEGCRHDRCCSTPVRRAARERARRLPGKTEALYPQAGDGCWLRIGP